MFTSVNCNTVAPAPQSNIVGTKAYSKPLLYAKRNSGYFELASLLDLQDKTITWAKNLPADRQLRFSNGFADVLGHFNRCVCDFNGVPTPLGYLLGPFLRRLVKWSWLIRLVTSSNIEPFAKTEACFYGSGTWIDTVTGVEGSPERIETNGVEYFVHSARNLEGAGLGWIHYVTDAFGYPVVKGALTFEDLESLTRQVRKLSPYVIWHPSGDDESFHMRGFDTLSDATIHYMDRFANAFRIYTTAKFFHSAYVFDTPKIWGFEVACGILDCYDGMYENVKMVLPDFKRTVFTNAELRVWLNHTFQPIVGGEPCPLTRDEPVYMDCCEEDEVMVDVVPKCPSCNQPLPEKDDNDHIDSN